MTIADYIVLAAVALCIAAAVYFTIRLKKRGGCCGNCSGCSCNCTKNNNKQK